VSLKYILLGLLDEPQSGYSIKQEFDRVFTHFWSAELAQIYPTLNRLEQQGLANSQQLLSRKGPAQRVYTRSEQGSSELSEWLMQGPSVGKDRLQYMAQVYFLSELPVGQRLDFFHKLQTHFVDEHADLRTQEEYWRAATAGYPDALDADEQCQQFTISLGIKKLAANTEWCEECIATLNASDRTKPRVSV